MKSFVKLLVLLPLFLFAIDDSVKGAIPNAAFPYVPWFTGPLLAPTPVNMKPGHPAIEPIVTAFDTYGMYDTHWKVKKKPKIYAVSTLVDFQMGFTDDWGLEVDVAFISNFQKGKSATHFQDSFIFLGYQVSNDKPGTWVPDFRLLVQEIFPTGKYQKFDPKKAAIESTGQGSYQTGVVLAFQKLFHLPNQFFAFHWSLAYIFLRTQADVKGLNTYGGSIDTKGKARPGRTVIGILSGEYSMNQNWVFVFDFQVLYQGESHFSGRRGEGPQGGKTSVTLPASTQISISPGLEYNFSRTSGLLFGTWLTLAGKNTNAFASLYGAYVYIF